MNLDKDTPPGTGNVFQEIRIGYVEQFNNGVHSIVNNFYGTQRKPQTDSRDLDNVKSIRDDILRYVEKTLPFVAYTWKDKYMALWTDILELPEVVAVIYNRGQQEDTRFNRKEVCHIINYLGKYANGGIGIFRNYVASRIAECFEDGKAHSVRPELGFRPTKEIQSAINKLMEEKYA